MRHHAWHLSECGALTLEGHRGSRDLGEMRPRHTLEWPRIASRRLKSDQLPRCNGVEAKSQKLYVQI